MPGSIDVANALEHGIRSEFESIYGERSKKVSELVDALFLKRESDGDFEIDHVWEDRGIFKPWAEGDPRPSSGFSDLSKRTYNFSWGQSVEWHERDEMDVRAKITPIERAREIASDAAKIPERVLQTLVTGTNDPEIFNGVGTCIDGYSFFSASHREHSSGNIVSGGGVATVSAIKTDWFKVIRRFREMLWPKSGEVEYWAPDEIDGAKFFILCSPTNEEIFLETFDLKNRAAAILNVAGAENVGGAAIENLIESKYGSRKRIIPWTRLTGNDWYVFMDIGAERSKQFVMQERTPLKESEQGIDSSRYFTHRLKAVGWLWEGGFQLRNWNAAIKVDN